MIPFCYPLVCRKVSCILTGQGLATGKVKPQEPSSLLDSPVTTEAESRLVSAKALYSLLVLQSQRRLGYSCVWEIKAPRDQFIT